MKRTYQTPHTYCVAIQPQQIIALSLPGDTDQTSGNLSRRRERPQRANRWQDYDDEEDYEEEEFY